MSADQETALLIDRLIDQHGEGGLTPTRADWAAIFALPPGQPLFVLTQLDFSTETDGSGLSGAAAYARFVEATATAFDAVGGTQIFIGPVHHGFGLGISGQWDAVMLVRFPSPRALADMWLRPDFIAATQAGDRGLARSRISVIDAAHSRQ